MATIVIAFIILILSSLFFGIQSMPLLFKLNATGKKIFWGFLIFFLLAPCFILVFYYIIRQYEFNIWIVGPLLFIGIMWLGTGFLAKVAYKTLTETNPRRKRVALTADVIKKRYRFSCLFFILAAALWLFGFFIGFGDYNYAFILLFIYFVIQGVAFILGNRKAIADGNVAADVNDTTPEAKDRDESVRAEESAADKAADTNSAAEQTDNQN